MDLAIVFAQYQDMLDADQDLREEIRLIVRELDTTGREVSLILQQIHQEDGLRQIEELCLKAKVTLAKANIHFSNLASKIPPNQYFRFNDHWRYVMQRYSFLAALIFFLESEKLALHSDVGKLLQVPIKEENGFHLDVEDYLSGLLQLASELSRLAVNSVTAGNYDLPIRISRFVSELNGGFRLLNLKNDSLRKRFDALKYDVKKIEEVVYDLSIRGLRSRSATITKGN
ncbi:translin [Daphnia magna]|uniref:translin n=1 Tax=Daphnia magna TaxID=35525 RepID=UPI0006E038A3|nr:translin [Daphnia magna]XP_032791763.1 translin [Daphnia magna]XP_032791764.1 translin [Daphnia magna]